MRLSKLYSNQPLFFKPVVFNDGLNVICAEIRLPDHTDEDTHNLGKSTVRELINFCLLSKVTKDHFLLANKQFNTFSFFLEIQLLDNTYLTICRATINNTKISFKKHLEKNSDFSELSINEWDHYQLPHEKAKQLLDSLLDLASISPYSFRKITGYFIRSQEQYFDAFNLNFQSKHYDWKPIVAKCLGLDSDLIKKSYEFEQSLEKLNLEKKVLTSQQQSNDAGEIEGLLALKRNDLDIKQKELDGLDFSNTDQATADFLAKDLSKQIQQINSDIYYIKANLQRVEESISTSKIKFNMNETQKIFKEAHIVFTDQVIKGYEQLLTFHSEIMSERRKYLLEEQKDFNDELTEKIVKLKDLNQQRSSVLSSYNSMDILERYKKLANEIASLKSHIEILEEQSKLLYQAKDIQTEIRDLTKELEKVQAGIETDVYKSIDSTSKSKFAEIRLNFSEIIQLVLSEPAVLNVSLNESFHLEFTTKFIDSSGNKTSADKGNSYKKLLCIAFDLALLKAYVDEKFPHFVFHDGVFETLDDRKKENLLKVMRELANTGIQQIITMIDSDTPKNIGKCIDWFEPNEIAVTLHDDGADGRLFNMSSW